MAEPNRFAGPLRPHERNPRYFTDDTRRAVYLTGSHTWATLHDRQLEETPKFDYDEWLDFMVDHGHNFLRMWAWEHAAWMQFMDRTVRYSPLCYARTGPGTAEDGLPKFDLEKFDESLFARLRERVERAGERGIYVSVMLFQGFSLDKLNVDSVEKGNRAYRGHPMNKANNINGIDGDPDGSGTGRQVHTLDNPEVTALQERYVRKVIDTLNDLDHVLWEIANEGHQNSVAWQYHMIRFIHDYEAGLPKQHPVGMTGAPIKNDDLYASPADWISPLSREPYVMDPPVADGRKVVIVDTDHGVPFGTDPSWPWRCFTRGAHFILMDPWRDARVGSPAEPVPEWGDIRKQLGYVRRLAERVDLAAMTPDNKVASKGFCLAKPGEEYVVFDSNGGGIAVDLTRVAWSFDAEWINLFNGETIPAGPVDGGAVKRFLPTFGGHAVLYLRKAE